jgi:hypothetical protein
LNCPANSEESEGECDMFAQSGDEEKLNNKKSASQKRKIKHVDPAVLELSNFDI